MRRSALLATVLWVLVLVAGCTRVSSEPPSDNAYVSRSSFVATETASVDWLVENSTSIIEGQVTAISEPLQVEDDLGDKVVCRDVTIVVSKCLKGVYVKNDEAVIRVLGGTAGGLTYDVDDQPAFVVGEKVLVMVSNSYIENVPLVTAGYFGKFKVQGAMALRETRVPEQARDVPLIDIENEAKKK